MLGSVNHRWRIRSTHVTSEGVVVYESCACGRHRMRLHSLLLHPVPNVRL